MMVVGIVAFVLGARISRCAPAQASAPVPHEPTIGEGATMTTPTIGTTAKKTAPKRAVKKTPKKK
jgi:hypothetical protein